MLIPATITEAITEERVFCLVSIFICLVTPEFTKKPVLYYYAPREGCIFYEQANNPMQYTVCSTLWLSSCDVVSARRVAHRLLWRHRGAARCAHAVMTSSRRDALLVCCYDVIAARRVARTLLWRHRGATRYSHAVMTSSSARRVARTLLWRHRGATRRSHDVIETFFLQSRESSRRSCRTTSSWKRATVSKTTWQTTWQTSRPTWRNARAYASPTRSVAASCSRWCRRSACSSRGSASSRYPKIIRSSSTAWKVSGQGTGTTNVGARFNAI